MKLNFKHILFFCAILFAFKNLCGQSANQNNIDFVLTKEDSALIDSFGLMVIDSDFNLITSDTLMSNRFGTNTLLITDDNGELSFIADTAGEYDDEYFSVENNVNLAETNIGTFNDEVKILNEVRAIKDSNDTEGDLIISDLTGEGAEEEFIADYYIIVGSGRNLPALLKLQQDILKSGYETEVIQNEKQTWYHLVLVGLFTKPQSTSTVFKLRELGFTEAWRMKLD